MYKSTFPNSHTNMSMPEKRDRKECPHLYYIHYYLYAKKFSTPQKSSTLKRCRATPSLETPVQPIKLQFQVLISTFLMNYRQYLLCLSRS